MLDGRLLPSTFCTWMISLALSGISTLRPYFTCLWVDSAGLQRGWVLLSFFSFLLQAFYRVRMRMDFPHMNNIYSCMLESILGACLLWELVFLRSF
jgi:hypothetical protein